TAAPGVLLPDLAPRSVGRVLYSVEDVSGASRELIRFDAYVYNAGSGPLEFVGSRPAVIGNRLEMTDVHQRVWHRADRRGAYEDLPTRARQTIYYEPAASHQHWHLAGAERYELIDPTGQTATIRSPKEEAGYCLTDDEPFGANAPSAPLF